MCHMLVKILLLCQHFGVKQTEHLQPDLDNHRSDSHSSHHNKYTCPRLIGLYKSGKYVNVSNVFVYFKSINTGDTDSR